MSEVLRLFNTATRSEQEFRPLAPPAVGMYTCGPTVYAPQHIGNLRSQLFADLLKRTLLWLGYEVTHVVNITDVGHLTDDADDGEDKMELAASTSGRRAEEIAAEYTEQWLRDRAAVGCLAPEVLCKATEHIPEQIALAERLEARGYTYRTRDGLYFDTARFPRYADFARLQLDAQEAGARIGEVAGKRNAADFALWKFAEDGVKRQQEWASPWGRGFPGWHLECSAMSVRYLGERFDIHTGGIDHVSVHHTNEIAQSECGFGVEPWVQYWLHNEFLIFGQEKMAKSTGNVLVLDDLRAAGHDPLAFRYFFLQAHYRAQQSFTEESMTSASAGFRRLRLHAAECAASAPAQSAAVETFRHAFRAALCDDLNAPRAMAVVWDVARSAELQAGEKTAFFAGVEPVLALGLGEPLESAERDPRIDGLLAERESARASRDFAEADRIRDRLLAEGIQIEDTPEGPRWSRARG